MSPSPACLDSEERFGMLRVMGPAGSRNNMSDDCELIQGSSEWKQARCGSLGASRIMDVMARTKNGYGASRDNIMSELIVEHLTGKPYESFVNADMQFGADNEDTARSAYEFYTGERVAKVGIIRHPSIQGTHASPDGVVGDYGLVEIKCPKSSTHIETLITRTIPGKYQKQMLWQMACTGREWCDYVSFDSRMPENLRLFVQRVEFDAEEVKNMEMEVSAFLAEMNDKLEKLKGLP